MGFTVSTLHKSNFEEELEGGQLEFPKFSPEQ